MPWPSKLRVVRISGLGFSGFIGCIGPGFAGLVGLIGFRVSVSTETLKSNLAYGGRRCIGWASAAQRKTQTLRSGSKRLNP